MNMTVINTSPSTGDIKSNLQASGKLDKHVTKKTFAEIQAKQVLSDAEAHSSNRVSFNATSASGDTVAMSHDSTLTVDQLLKQGNSSFQNGDDPKAASDSSRVIQQSVAVTATAIAIGAGTSVQTVSVTASQREDQLLIQGHLAAIKQSTDPKVAVDGSKSAGQTVAVAATIAAQATTDFPVGTFKAMFGDLPSGFDRSGFSNIIDGQGHNLTNQEIASYFDQNPSTAQMEKDKVDLGLSDAQMANAIAIATGRPYTASSLDSNTIGVTGSSDGSLNAAINRYASTWGAASGVQSGVVANAAASTVVSYLA